MGFGEMGFAETGICETGFGEMGLKICRCLGKWLLSCKDGCPDLPKP